MKNPEFHNPHSAGTGELALLSGRRGNPTLKRAFEKRVTQAALAGLGYCLWAVADAYANPFAPFDQAAMHMDALVRSIIVGAPTALVYFRRGPFSASILSLVALLNTSGHFMSWVSGDPEIDLLTVAAHAPFLFFFVRGAHAAFRLRRTSKG